MNATLLNIVDIADGILPSELNNLTPLSLPSCFEFSSIQGNLINELRLSLGDRPIKKGCE